MAENEKKGYKPTTKVSIELLQSDLKDLKQLYDNEIKENKLLISKNQQLKADLLIKQEIIDSNLEKSKDEIEELNLFIQEKNIEIEVLNAKLGCKDDLISEFREIIYKLININNNYER